VARASSAGVPEPPRSLGRASSGASVAERGLVPSRSVVVAGLVKSSSHPVASVAVTAAATLLAVGAGNDAGSCVLVAAAVLTGQFSVGGSNTRSVLPACW
jgi:hypothetical protein